MVFDETPHNAAPRGVQRTLVVAGFFVVLLAMLTTVAAAQAALPRLDFGLLNSIGIYALLALVYLASVRLTYEFAVTAQASRRWAGRRALYSVAAFVFLLDGLLMAIGDAGIAGFLVAGLFGALGPFFLAGLLDEKTGIWLTSKGSHNNTSGLHVADTCR